MLAFYIYFFPIFPFKTLGMGTVNKVYLKFAHQWWENNLNGFALLWSSEEKRHYKEQVSDCCSIYVLFKPYMCTVSVCRLVLSTRVHLYV